MCLENESLPIVLDKDEVIWKVYRKEKGSSFWKKSPLQSIFRCRLLTWQNGFCPNDKDFLSRKGWQVFLTRQAAQAFINRFDPAEAKFLVIKKVSVPKGASLIAGEIANAPGKGLCGWRVSEITGFTDKFANGYRLLLKLDFTQA